MNARALTLSLLLLAGCPKDEAPPSDDRLLKKLQAEKDRLAQGGQASMKPAPSPNEPNPLAERAAAPDAPKLWPVTGNPNFTVGKTVFHVASVETSHSARGEKLSIASEDLFVKVTLTAQAAGGATIDFSTAKLVAGEVEHPLAPDAQRLAGSRQLSRTLRPDEKIEQVLIFEAPAAALAPGLKLVVAGGDGVALQ